MRQIVLHAPGDVRLDEVPDPSPGPGEVVVRVDVALTCATDAKMARQGRHPALPPLPAPLGHEAAGTVVAVGPGAHGVAVGDAVVVGNSAPCGGCFFCDRGRPSLCERPVYLTGAFAELLRVPARIVTRNLMPLPPGLEPARAAMVEPLGCAVRTVERSAAQAGDYVVVLGGGAQGQMLTAVLVGRGCRVTVCDPHEDRRRRALRFGAVAALPAPRDAAGAARVRAATPGGRGADVVFEAVGRPEAWQAAVGLARAGGEVNLHGGCAPGTTVTLPTHALHYGELRVQGSYHHTPEALRTALALLAQGTAPYGELLGPPVGLEEVPAALAAGGAKRPVLPRGR